MQALGAVIEPDLRRDLVSLKWNSSWWLKPSQLSIRRIQCGVKRYQRMRTVRRKGIWPSGLLATHTLPLHVQRVVNPEPEEDAADCAINDVLKSLWPAVKGGHGREDHR